MKTTAFLLTMLAPAVVSAQQKPTNGPMQGHAPILPVEHHHWDLHVWLWKANPNGLMHPTNSTVKCPDGPYTFHEAATKMAHP